MCFYRLRVMGFPWNHKRVYQVYKAMKLNLARRKMQRLPAGAQQAMEVDARASAEWSKDFMPDTVYHGRRFRTSNFPDEGVRKALDIVIDTSIPGGRVFRTFDQLLESRGKPDGICVDNGPRYISQAVVDWCDENDVTLKRIQPGNPNQNAQIERFKRTYRNDVLSVYVFESLSQVRQIIRQWSKCYNDERQHSSLEQLPPAMFRRLVENARNSNFRLSH